MSEKREHESSQSGKVHGYSIEARSPKWPTQIGDQIIAQAWVEIQVRDALGKGVPNPIFSTIAHEAGLMTYPTAMAIMAMLATLDHRDLCVEFRLVKKILNYEWNIKRESVSDPVNFYQQERNVKWSEST